MDCANIHTIHISHGLYGRRQLNSSMLPSCLRLFSRTVRLLRRVVHLDLNVFIGMGSPFILDDSCEFSRLRNLKLSDMSVISPSFLRRHQMLEHLAVRHIICPCEAPLSTTHMIHLPNLKSYIGPLKLIPLIIPGSSICHAGLLCGHNLPASRWVGLMLHLRQSRAPIWVFECHMRAFQKDMMFAIGKYLPDLRVLRLVDQYVWNGQVRTSDTGNRCKMTEQTAKRTPRTCS